MPRPLPPMTKEPSVHRALPCQRAPQPGLALVLLLQPRGTSVTRRPSPVTVSNISPAITGAPQPQSRVSRLLHAQH